jgi:hypothetical protein
MPAGLTTTDLELNKKDVILVVQSNSLISIDKFLNSMIALSAKKQVIDSLIIENLTVNQKTGSYAISFKTTLL